MNALGVALVWGVVQVTLFTLIAAALYAAVRRRGPAAGSLAALSSVVLILGVTALALAPWPRWYSLTSSPEISGGAQGSASRPRPVSPDQDPTTAGMVASDPAAGTPRRAATPPPNDSIYGQAFLRAFWEELRLASARPGSQSAWRWPAGFAALLLALMGLALCRLAVGLAAIERDRRRSRLIADAPLAEMARQLAGAMGNRRQIELRESARISTPATFGWLSPTVLLPDSWRQWTDQEQRAVLAHEIAHIARGDYLASLVAQFSLACHFYHPLVHWLVRRLRFEQELAADALGAEYSGGRQPYLMTLARMALSQDNRRVAWASRPFLPSRGMLIRRIEMLRYTNPLCYVALAPWSRAALIAALVASGLFVAGLRGPAGGDALLARDLLAQDDRPGNPSSRQGQAANPGDPATIDWTYVPHDSLGVVVIKPAEILSRPETKQLLDKLNQQFKLEANSGLPFDKLQSVQIALIKGGAKLAQGRLTPQEAFAAQSPTATFILRTSGPHDWSQLTAAVAPHAQPADYLGQQYFQAAAPHQLSYFMPDEQTIVLSEQRRLLQQILAARRPKQHPWAGRLDKVAGRHLSALIDVKALRAMLPANPPPGSTTAITASLAPLWKDTEELLIGVTAGDGLSVEAIASCHSAEQAERVQETARAALTLAGNAFAQGKKELAAAPPEAAGMILLLTDVAEELLSTAQIERGEGDANLVQLSATCSLDVTAALSMLTPALGAARQAAGRSQSANNLKQLALAMYNYHDAHGRLPSAVVVGPDGKTPHSWRIELLPFLESSELYEQYRMEEPWDSENNLKVLQAMPPVFRAPSADPDSHNSSYFLVTGSASAFDGTRAARFSEVRDGTSYTIMLVEARRDIPWTRPEDITYDPQKPLPEFGGHFPGGFHAAMMDGSVRFLGTSEPGQPDNDRLLRALLTHAGAEVVEFPNN